MAGSTGTTKFLCNFSVKAGMQSWPAPQSNRCSFRCRSETLPKALSFFVSTSWPSSLMGWRSLPTQKPSLHLPCSHIGYSAPLHQYHLSSSVVKKRNEWTDAAQDGSHGLGGSTRRLFYTKTGVRVQVRASSGEFSSRGDRQQPPLRPAGADGGPRLAPEPFDEEPSQNLQFFATCLPGLEEIVAEELLSPLIRASRVEIGSSGVAFSGSLATGYRANLWLRCAVRVLQRLSSGHLSTQAPAGDTLYAFVRESVDWSQLIDPRAPAPALRGGERGGPGGSSRVQGPDSSGRRGNLPLGTAEAVPRKCRPVARTFSVESRVWDCSTVTSSQLVSTRAKDAICDTLRDAYGGLKPQPPATGEFADLPLYLSLFRDHAVLYRDMSGWSLHKRGYRDVMHKASLNEGLAAGVLSLANWAQVAAGAGGGTGTGSDGGSAAEARLQSARWQTERAPERRGAGAGAGEGREEKEAVEQSTAGVLLDPMCGSGTLLIEAALMATNRAPGLFRETWPFQSWPDYDPATWASAVSEAAASQRPLPAGVRLLGNDVHPGALSLCERDARAAGVLPHLELSCADCREYRPPAAPSQVVVNPPWGTRLGETSGEEAEWLADTWQALGRFLKSHCSHADVFVLSGNARITRELCMRASKKWPVTSGGIECRVMRYHVLPAKPIRDEAREAAAGERKGTSWDEDAGPWREGGGSGASGRSQGRDQEPHSGRVGGEGRGEPRRVRGVENGSYGGRGRGREAYSPASGDARGRRAAGGRSRSDR